MLSFGHSSSGILLGVGAIELSRTGGVGPAWWLVPLVFAAGIGGHYVGDFIPHGHYHLGANHLSVKGLTLWAFDFVAVIILFLGIALHRFGLGFDWLLLAAAIAGAQMPDLFEVAVDFKVIPNGSFARAERRWHYDIIHWHNPKPRIGRDIAWIDLWQVMVFGLALWLLVRLPAK